MGESGNEYPFSWLQRNPSRDITTFDEPCVLFYPSRNQSHYVDATDVG